MYKYSCMTPSLRFAGTMLRDLDRPVDRIRIEVSEIERWRDRFIQAIEDNAIIVVSYFL